MMKNVFTFLMCIFCILTGIAQTDSNGTRLVIPERTPELRALYLQAKQLESNGTAAKINANRLAIKEAWQEVNPEIAALYKPLNSENVSIPTISEGSYAELRSPEDWEVDGLLREGFIDGVDVDVASSGNLYVAAFENFVGSDADDTSLYVYRSTDDGNTFSLWKSIVMFDVTVHKIQAISMDGIGDNYLLAYMNSDVSLYGVRINMANGDYDVEGISNNVTDFSMDRNYPGNTSDQQVFATFVKDEGSSNNQVFSARSIAGSYGFDWVDEVNLGIVGEQISFSYGLNGSCYTAFIGLNSRSVRATVNTDYNDPASWGYNETVVSGISTESLNPTIRSTRKGLSNDEVLIFTSYRDEGTTDPFIGGVHRRLSGSSYSFMRLVSTTDKNIVQFDTWIRRDNDVETIQTSFVQESIGGIGDNFNNSFQYNGNVFEPLKRVSDIGIDVFEGFPSAIAETADGLPCMAFAGTDTTLGGIYGHNLYFDRNSTLGIEENSLRDFTFYPNPVKEILNLSTKNKVQNVSIYSILGQKVIQSSPKQISPSINISSLTPGVYVMKVEVDGQTGSYKIIKE